MKYLLSLLFVSLWITGAAQETCSRIIDRAMSVPQSPLRGFW